MYYKQCHTEDRTVNHKTFWLMFKSEPLGAKGTAPTWTYTTCRRANTFVFSLNLSCTPHPLQFIDIECTFQLSSVDCTPIARTKSIAVRFFGGFRLLNLNDSVQGFLYMLCAEALHFPHRWGSTKSSLEIRTRYLYFAAGRRGYLATPRINLALRHTPT
jgi:hypothetical protein